MAGMRREPMAVASETALPVIPAKNMLAAMLTCANPPRKDPTKAAAMSISFWAIPPLLMNCPASMKKGMARRGKLSRPRMKRWARTTSGISAPPQRSQKKQARPTAKAMGTFNKKRGTREPKRISIGKPCSTFAMEARRKRVSPSR